MLPLPAKHLEATARALRESAEGFDRGWRPWFLWPEWSDHREQGQGHLYVSTILAMQGGHKARIGPEYGAVTGPLPDVGGALADLVERAYEGCSFSAS